MKHLLSLDWFYYLWVVVFSAVGFYGCYILGKHRGRREVIYLFDKILVQIYELFLSGKNKELYSFLGRVSNKTMCGDVPLTEKRNNKSEGDYIQ